MSWKIDGILFSDYGIRVESSQGILDMPRLDIPSHDWLDRDGLTFSPRRNTYLKKDRQVSLDCWVKGTSYSDFKSKVENFWSVIKGSGKRVLTSDYIPGSLEVFVQKKIPVTRAAGWNHSKQIGHFKLRFTVNGDSAYKDLDVYAPDGTLRQTVKHGKDFKQSFRLQGENFYTGIIESNSMLSIQRGDYIDVDGEKFFLFQEPEVKKESTNKYTYRSRFEHEFFKLRSVQFRIFEQSEVYHWATLDGFLDLLIENLNRNYTGLFTKGNVAATTNKYFHFKNYDCLQALKYVASEYDLEFDYTYNAGVIEISVVEKVGENANIDFEYGSERGLYDITRDAIRNDELVTVLYAEGSTKNLPAGYGSLRLQMPVKNLTANTSIYGKFERSKIFDDIFPERESTVTGYEEILDETEQEVEQYIVTDSSLVTEGLNIKDYLVPNTPAKLAFNSGDLAGFEFEIHRYEEETGQIWIKQFVDEHGNRFPNSTLQPKVGDKYVFLDIYLPDEYVNVGSTCAEVRLQERAQQYLDENSTPKITYRVNVDPFFMQNLILNYGFVNLRAGDRVNVYDADFSINQSFRISDLQRSKYDDSYTLVLSETTVVTKAEELRNKIARVEKAVEATNQEEVVKKLKNIESVGTLKNKVFDPVDDRFNPENNRDESIDPRMLSYDSGAPQFSLQNALVECNVGGDEDAVNVGAGKLTMHNFKQNTLSRWEIKQLKDNGLTYDPTRTWEIPETNFQLTSKQGYWLYARLNMTAGSTECILEVAQEHIEIKHEVENGYLKYKLGHISDASSPRTAAMLWGNVKGYKNSEYNVVNQIAHGFSEKQAIRHNGTQFDLACADTAENAQTAGIVVEIIDADHFRYQSGGFYSHPDWIAGTEYFLSPITPGLVTTEYSWTYPDDAGKVRQHLGYGTDRGLKIEIDVGDVIGAESASITTEKHVVGTGKPDDKVRLYGDVERPITSPNKYYGTKDGSDETFHSLPEEAVQELSGTSPTFDMEYGRGAKIVLTADTTITFSNLKPNDNGHVEVKQDAAGGHRLMFSGASIEISEYAFAAQNEVVLTGVAGSNDVVAWWYTGSVMKLAVIYNFLAV